MLKTEQNHPSPYRYIGADADCFGLPYTMVDTVDRRGDEKWKNPEWPFKKSEIFLISIPSDQLSNIQVTNIAEFRKQKGLDPAFESCYIWMGNKKEFQENFTIYRWPRTN